MHDQRRRLKPFWIVLLKASRSKGTFPAGDSENVLLNFNYTVSRETRQRLAAIRQE